LDKPATAAKVVVSVVGSVVGSVVVKVVVSVVVVAAGSVGAAVVGVLRVALCAMQLGPHLFVVASSKFEMIDSGGPLT